MGCQDLLEDVPGRSRKDQGVFSSPSDSKSWYKLKTSSSKSYSIKDETSSKSMSIYLILLPLLSFKLTARNEEVVNFEKEHIT